MHALNAWLLCYCTCGTVSPQDGSGQSRLSSRVLCRRVTTAGNARAAAEVSATKRSKHILGVHMRWTSSLRFAWPSRCGPLLPTPPLPSRDRVLQLGGALLMASQSRLQLQLQLRMQCNADVGTQPGCTPRMCLAWKLPCQARQSLPDTLKSHLQTRARHTSYAVVLLPSLAVPGLRGFLRVTHTSYAGGPTDVEHAYAQPGPCQYKQRFRNEDPGVTMMACSSIAAFGALCIRSSRDGASTKWQ